MCIRVENRAMHVFRPSSAIDDVFDSNREGRFRGVDSLKGVRKVRDERKAVFDESSEFREGFLTDPVPLAIIVFTVLN